MNKLLQSLVFLFFVAVSNSALAFCGFYVARADQKLYNDASQVVLVRDGDRTVVTMNNNFRGAVNEFALVVPVPTVLAEGLINVADRSLIEHLDAYTAPRLVEYFDEDPCRVMYRLNVVEEMAMQDAAPSSPARAKNLGVTVEAEYTVGEYDILILSAEESRGLLIWLEGNNYHVPVEAIATVSSYLKQGMKFFVAKVNLDVQQQLGYSYLRPIQIAYESPKFMLPLRLGTVNAAADQYLTSTLPQRLGREQHTLANLTGWP